LNQNVKVTGTQIPVENSLGPIIVLAIYFATTIVLLLVLWPLLRWLKRKLTPHGRMTNWALTISFLVTGLFPLEIFIFDQLMGNLGSANYQYKQVFGIPPNAEIERLRADASYGTDYNVIFLSFDATPAAVQTILETGFQQSKPTSKMMPSNSDSNSPDWWRGKYCNPTSTYQLSSFRRWDDLFAIQCDTKLYIYASYID
jgi:hypothetical protein